MTSERLGGMFEGDSAETCGIKFPLISMGGQAEGLVCADLVARTPIGVSRNLKTFQAILKKLNLPVLFRSIMSIELSEMNNKQIPFHPGSIKSKDRKTFSSKR